MKSDLQETATCGSKNKMTCTYTNPVESSNVEDICLPRGQLSNYAVSIFPPVRLLPARIWTFHFNFKFCKWSSAIILRVTCGKEGLMIFLCNSKLITIRYVLLPTYPLAQTLQNTCKQQPATTPPRERDRKKKLRKVTSEVIASWPFTRTWYLC